MTNGFIIYVGPTKVAICPTLLDAVTAARRYTQHSGRQTSIKPAQPREDAPLKLNRGASRFANTMSDKRVA